MNQRMWWWLGLPMLALTALVALVVLGACAPITTLNALSPRGGHTVTEGQAYGALPRHKLDVYQPNGTPGASIAGRKPPPGGWPVVVFFYGGSWNRGQRADYQFVGAALAERGVLTLVADYRLHPEVRYPDFLRDCAQALAFGLRQAAALGGNPKRVFVMGHSAGAYNAAMLALDPRWLAAVGHSPTELAGWLGLAGPYDFLPMSNPEAQPVFFHPNYPAGTQPIDHASAASPRAFLAAASADQLVNPQRNSVSLADRLRAAGVAVDLKTYAGVNHMTLAAAMARPLQWMAPVLNDTLRFIGPDTALD